MADRERVFFRKGRDVYERNAWRVDLGPDHQRLPRSDIAIVRVRLKRRLRRAGFVVSEACTTRDLARQIMRMEERENG